MKAGGESPPIPFSEMQQTYPPPATLVSHRDRLPGVAIVGCGGIVHEAHLPVYRHYGVPVVGVFDISARTAEYTAQKFGVQRVYRSYEELLDDADVGIVDIATHPRARPDLIHRALTYEKHVFAQKPLAADMNSARDILQWAASSSNKVAVNQNARWAPPWRLANQLISEGAIGEILSITFLQNTDFTYITGTTFDHDPYFTIIDFSIHWIDILRCWMDEARPGSVRARQFRVPGQPTESRTPWGLSLNVSYLNGVEATIRGTGRSYPSTQGHPFWIHGSKGTIRGRVRHHEFLELEREQSVQRFDLQGGWYLDGFAGAFAELIDSIREDRLPYNSVAHNMKTLEIAFAACASADENGTPVTLSSRDR
jgi:predicted dehydrogenase